MHTGDWKGVTSVSQVNGGSFQYFKPNGIDYYLGEWDQTNGKEFSLKLVQTSDGTTNGDGITIPQTDYAQHSQAELRIHAKISNLISQYNVQYNTFLSVVFFSAEKPTIYSG